MDEDLFGSKEMPQSFAWVFLEQSPQETLDLVGESCMGGESELFVEDALIDFLVIETVVRRDAQDQFVK